MAISQQPTTTPSSIQIPTEEATHKAINPHGNRSTLVAFAGQCYSRIIPLFVIRRKTMPQATSLATRTEIPTQPPGILVNPVNHVTNYQPQVVVNAGF